MDGYLSGLMIHPNEKIITDTNYHREANAYIDENGRRKKGLVERDWDETPQGHYRGEVGMHAVDDLPTFDPKDFGKLIQLQLEEGRRLSDFRAVRGPNGGMIPARDQNGRGYCWRHSGSGANLLLRARQNFPYVDISPYAGACLIKRYRDEGGWGAQGLDDIMNFGDATSKFWPQQAVDSRYDTPEMRADAARHKITEGFIDMGSPQYDRKLTVNQMISCLLACIPVIVDFNWWGHSVCAMDVVSGVSQWGVTRADSGKLLDLKEFNLFWGVDTLMMGLAIRILNSWGDSWSESGAGLLTGSRAVPDGATAPRLTSYSLAV